MDKQVSSFNNVPERDYCRSLVDQSNRAELQSLVARIGELLDSEGGPPVALVIAGYCNGVYLLKGDEAQSHLIFFYKDEAHLLEEPYKS